MNTTAPAPSKTHMQSLIDTSIIPNQWRTRRRRTSARSPRRMPTERQGRMTPAEQAAKSMFPLDLALLNAIGAAAGLYRWKVVSR